jgi:hypothetical protein
MRYLWTAIIAVTVVGCATQPAAKETSAQRHAANIAATEHAGYRVVNHKGQTLFCATKAPTASTEWEHQQLWVWHGLASTAPSTNVESGRSPWSGASSAGR